MSQLELIEQYYDEAPRANADAHEVGPFTLFVAREGWPYYARPRVGEQDFKVDDVTRVVREQRARRLPQSLEWVHEVTPALLAPATAAGLRVAHCPLLVLDATLDAGDGLVVDILKAEDPRLGRVFAAIEAGFSETDRVRAEPVREWVGPRIRRRLLSVAGAFNASGDAVGGGSHAVRDGVSELTGIAVLPQYRRRGIGAAITKVLADDAAAAGATTVFLSAGTDDVARVYERVGFRRVGTACIAAAPSRQQAT
ncbi:MAG: GNAT family N-acetyltransferase [Nocardioidaceae bacterium]|nr:GNAT family N-acetyltransferase [Nocardioidaceae bacterium]